MSTEKIIEDRYLGDGVYASFDGYHIWLDLRKRDSSIRIALDPDVFQNLINYSQDIVNIIRENKE